MTKRGKKVIQFPSTKTHHTSAEPTPFERFRAQLEAERDTLQAWGAVEECRALDRVLQLFDEMVDRLRNWAVSYEEAARISGLSEGTIRNRVAKGDLTTLGRLNGRSRVLASELVGSGTATDEMVAVATERALRASLLGAAREAI